MVKCWLGGDDFLLAVCWSEIGVCETAAASVDWMKPSGCAFFERPMQELDELLWILRNKNHFLQLRWHWIATSTSARIQCALNFLSRVFLVFQAAELEPSSQVQAKEQPRKIQQIVSGKFQGSQYIKWR